MLIKMKIAQRVSLSILFTTLFSFEMKAQVGLSLNNTTYSQSSNSSNKYSSLLNKKYSQTLQNQRLTATTPTALRKAPPSNINAPYYQFSVEAMPFFCKIEYKMGLNKKLPVKFRLGDVQYVDELEGK